MTYWYDPKTSEIWGRMFHDTDGDNTENNGSGGYEPGIAGQVVKLLNAHGQVIATTTTNSHGNYKFICLPAGDYTIQFPTSVDDKTLVEKDVGDFGTDSDADQSTGKTIQIHLGKAQTICEVDAGYRFDPDLDGVVQGTGGDDLIDLAYTGDPDGDRIDNGDAILPGEAAEDDIVVAGDGDDTVRAGAGDDEVYGGNGDDTLFGEEGDDVLYGDRASPYGDPTETEAIRESFEWSKAGVANGHDLGDFTQDTGNVTVSFKVLQETGHADTEFAANQQKVHSISTDGSAANKFSSLSSTTNGAGNQADYELSFSDPVENVSFRINDIDGDGIVRVTAFDAAGQKIAVNLSGGSRLTLKDTDSVPGADTADSKGGYLEDTAPEYSLLVDIPGPVARIVLEHDQDGHNNSGINVTDVYFDAMVPVEEEGAPGNDEIYGGAGNDVIYGGEGDDLLVGGSGDDNIFGGDDADRIVGGAGDDVDGGAGGNDHDILDLTGAGPFYLEDVRPDSNGNGFDGTVVFVDDDGNPTGETLVFTEIEEILGDEVNRAPVAQDDSATTDEDTPVTIDVLANDSDPDGDKLSVTEATSPDGEVTINPDGTITFTPDEDFNGETTITYTVTDPDGNTDTGEVTVTVNPVNDAPVAVDDSATTDEDTPVEIDVLGNDSDPDGDPLSVTEASVPADQGTVEIVDGKLVFTPAENFNGETTITYTVSDGNGGEDTATVTVEVAPVNDAPVAQDDTASTDEDTPVTIDVLANDGDVDGDPLTVTEATSPDGDVTINPDGTLTFTPAPDFNGETTITYTVSDGNGGEDTATVTVEVAPVNDAPVAQDDTASTDEDTPVTIDVLANDSDVDGDPLTVTEATSPDGDVTINSDGTLTFTPTPGFSGDATVTYTVDDGNGGTDTATLFVTVEENPLDGTVEGTAGDDLIDVNYLGDPDGDRVDNEDAILPGAAPNDDLIFGFEGNDTILAGLGDDEVYGGDDDDVINGGAGDDTLFGDDGDDSIEGGTGNDSIYGGEGNDTLRGGQDDDLIEGGNGDDSLFGGSGNDTLIAGAGNDEITGGSGDDVIFAGEGDDSVIAGSGDDTVYGGGGNNTISTGDGNDVVYLGDGDNVVDTSGHAPIPDIGYPGVYPSDPDPNDDRDLVFGGAGNDTITTGDDRDTIFGGAGNDVIDAGIDDDYVEAGEGDDTVIGGEGRDTILGGDGDDVLYGGLDLSVSDLVNLPDDGSGPFGPDLVTDNNIDTIFGGDGNDTIYGMDDNDELYGGEGDDVVFGGVDNDLIHGDAGNDTLSGDQGDDTIFGGDGDDVIEGGIGADQMFGGFGSDTFLGGNGGDVVIGGEDPDGNDWDVLDLTGSNVDFITYDEDDPTYDPVTGVGESGTVTFLDGSTMTFAEIENVIPCFTPGTTIATPRGERLVEELQEGDRIITRDNGIQEIRWVGHKVIDGKALVRNPHLKPILIKAGALGNGLPERDMLVSPNHRILVSGDKTQLYFEESEVLAAAKHLVGAEGIHQVDVMQTTYVHFMFDRHEVVLSNGAWTESFQPGDYSLKGIGNSQRTEIFELFPELKSKPGLEGYQAARRALKKHEAKLLLK